MTKSVGIVLLLLLGVASRSLGQSFNLDVIAGANYSNFLPFSGPDTYSPSHHFGYQAGLLVGVTKKRLSIQTGLIYEQFEMKEGYTNVGPGGSSQDIVTLTPHYLQIPLNFLYKTPSKLGNVFFGGGPYISFGVSGKVNDTGVGYSALGGGPDYFSSTTPYQFSKYDNPDYGLKAIGGISLKNRVMLTVSFDHGMKYLFYGSYDNKNYGLTNDVLSLSVGYAIF